MTRIMMLQGVKDIEDAIGVRGILMALLLVSTGGGNLAYYPVVWRLVQSEAPVPFLGLGPGMVSSTAAVQLDAPLFRNVLYDYFGQTRFGLDGAVESQVLATAGEMGIPGFLAALSLIVIWIVVAIRAYRRARTATERALGAGVFAAALGAIFLIPIRNVWETPQISFSLWFPGAVLLAVQEEIRRRRVPSSASADPSSTPLRQRTAP
jgi:hypothetical protein